MSMLLVTKYMMSEATSGRAPSKNQKTMIRKLIKQERWLIKTPQGLIGNLVNHSWWAKFISKSPDTVGMENRIKNKKVRR